MMLNTAPVAEYLWFRITYDFAAFIFQLYLFANSFPGINDPFHLFL